MAGSEYTTEQEQAAATPIHQGSRSPGRLLISLAQLAPEALEVTLAHIAEALPDHDVHIPIPENGIGGARSFGHLTLVPYNPSISSDLPWIQTAADYLTLHELSRSQDAAFCLVLGAEAQSLEVPAIRNLAEAAFAGADLVAPRYEVGPREGLVNSAILYPVSRALYGAQPRFPLAVDLALSPRMTERLATAAQRYTSLGQNDALLWPVSEAAVAGYTIAQVNAGPRSVPQPAIQDLNTVLAMVAGSLFADVEAKAAFWQRSRVTPPQPALPGVVVSEFTADVNPMIESFRLAYTNLQEIWSLVLPPQSLLGLKKLSLLSAESFRMPDALWARTVYDFSLAFRLRTLNRGHLLGALTPLYLAWVASHLSLIQAGSSAEKHVEETSAAFEAEKPYLVSRWRWPDRFNP